MKIFIIKLSVFFFLIISPLFAQEDIQLGSLKYQQRGMTGFYDFSDPTGINIKIQIWGYVRFPGYYIINAKSNLNDLISFAGGPTEDALMEDIRIFRTLTDSTVTLQKFNYNDLLWSKELNSQIKFPRLLASDMVLVPGEPRYFLREDISFFLSITAAIASITAVILSILK